MMTKQGWYPAAGYYAYRLQVVSGSNSLPWLATYSLTLS